MASRRRYGVWDDIALQGAMIVSGRRVPMPARLAIPRTRAERLHRWLNRSPLVFGALTRFEMSLTVGFVVPLFVASLLWRDIRTSPLFAICALTLLPTMRMVLEAIVTDPRLVVFRRERLRVRHAAPKRAVVDMAERRRHWTHDLKIHQRQLHTRLFLRSPWSAAFSVAWGLVGLPLLAIWTLIPDTLETSALGSAYTLLGSIVLGLLVISAIAQIGTARRYKRVLASINEEICSDCGYPLPSSPSPATAGSDADLFGPPVCPECGTPWPRIPPTPLFDLTIAKLREHYREDAP